MFAPVFEKQSPMSLSTSEQNTDPHLADGWREEAITFVLETGLALHNAGAASHRLEDMMTRMSETLGLSGAFLSTPTSLQATFNGNPPRTVLLRTEPGTVHLGILAEIDVVAQAAAEGKLMPREGLRALSTLRTAAEEKEHALWTRLSPAIAGGLVSGSAARMLGGGINDVMVATLLGVIVGVIGRQFSRRPRVSKVTDLAATTASVALAHLLSHAIGIQREVVALAGVIVLVPGFTLTLALTELATRHLVSGTARLMAAAITFLQIAVGYAVGSRIGQLLGESALVPTMGTSFWTDALSVVIAGLGVALLMNARLAVTGWVMLGVAIAVYTAKAAAPELGPELGAGVAAFALGIYANFYAQMRRRPATEVLSPGVILLVPGAIGFVSLRSLLQSDVMAGVQGVFTMTMVGAAIVVGLLTANAVIPPRRLL